MLYHEATTGRLMPVIPVIPIRTAPPMPPDGLYQVTTSYLCAGFTIYQGRVTNCAPILRQRLAYWLTVAVRIDEMGKQDP